jgi:hypothetical protein
LFETVVVVNCQPVLNAPGGFTQQHWQAEVQKPTHVSASDGSNSIVTACGGHNPIGIEWH